jgi:hypothetical protein
MARDHVFSPNPARTLMTATQELHGPPGSVSITLQFNEAHWKVSPARHANDEKTSMPVVVDHAVSPMPCRPALENVSSIRTDLIYLYL